MADNINKKIVSALAPIGLPVAESLYEGGAKEYTYYVIALNRVADNGDNCPQAYAASVQIHYVCEWEKSYDATVRNIRRALRDADFVGLNVVDMSDPQDRIRHFIIEAEVEDEYSLEE